MESKKTSLIGFLINQKTELIVGSADQYKTIPRTHLIAYLLLSLVS